MCTGGIFGSGKNILFFSSYISVEVNQGLVLGPDQLSHDALYHKSQFQVYNAFMKFNFTLKMKSL